jgi:hypothetical protein
MMNSYYTLSTFGTTLFGMIAICVTIAAAFTLINAVVLRVKGRNVTAAVISAAASFFMLQQFGDITAQLENHGNLNAWGSIVGQMPVIVVIAVMAALAIIEAGLIKDIIKKRRTMLMPNSIKESLDDLPDGICFSTEDGQPLMINTKMNEISESLFGSVVMNVKECEKKLFAREFVPGVEVLSHESASTVLADGGVVWDIHTRILDTDQGRVTETLAFDVTDQYELSRELERNNKILADVNISLKNYSEEMDRLTREEEILAAKTKVHDDIGRSLLSFRTYLAQPEEMKDRAGLLERWRHDIKVMKNEADPAPQRDGWELLKEAAAAVGVDIVMDGEMPSETKPRAILVNALHECLTNTVRHAHGKEISVKIGRNDDMISAAVTNDGVPPDGPVEETGGLKNLRCGVECAGGCMSITSDPRFVLNISIPMEDR